MGQRALTPGGDIVPFPAVSVGPSLPHILAPIDGEGLLGFCLRLDLVNGFRLGTVATKVKRHVTAWHSLRAASWASGAIFDLRRLAILSGNDLASVQDLTFQPSLRRLFGHVVSIESLGDMHHGVCESCWAERRLIRRMFLLEHVTACLDHRERLVALDRARLASIVCAVPLPGQAPASDGPITADELARQRDVARVWALLLDTGTPAVVGAGYRVVSGFGRHQPPGVRAAARRLQAGRTAVATLVDGLIALQIEPAVLAELLESDEPLRPCPNKSCAKYSDRPLGQDRPAEKHVEQHCPTCGTRFIGRRILLTFDIDHGARSPRRSAVLRAQSRLRKWKVALSVTCARMIAEGATITIGEAFMRANVPDGAYLRAERLGLAALVRDAGRRQRMAETRAGGPFYSIEMDDYRALMEAARARDWIGIAEWARAMGVRPTLPDRRVSDFDAWCVRRGILEPVFSGSWTRSVRSANEVKAVWDLTREMSPDLLTHAWLQRQMKRLGATDPAT